MREDDKNTQRYIDVFKKNICKACGLCKPNRPSFCMIVYGGEPDRFYVLLSYLNVLKRNSKKDFKDVFTFEGFCGVFCNSGLCPQRSDRCTKLEQAIDCYQAFVSQSVAKFTDKLRKEIVKEFGNMPVKQIGDYYRLKVNDPLLLINKKKKRKKARNAVYDARWNMTRALDKIEEENKNHYKTSKVKVNSVVIKKKPKTDLICNDDKEWRAKIEEYLARETNYRQSTKPAQRTSGN